MRRPLLVAGLLLAACDHTHPRLLPPDSESGVSWPMLGGDRARSSWNSNERLLAPMNVASGNFGLLWESPPIGMVSGTSTPAAFSASPLYVDGLKLILAPTTNGLYAYDAEDGTERWLDSGGGTVHNTPVVDLRNNRAYYQYGSFTVAIDVMSMNTPMGWPLQVGLQDTDVAPALSPDGTLLYVASGSTVTAIDTRGPSKFASFSTGGGDIVGLAVNSDGRVFGTVGHATMPQWTNALLEWNATLDLIGTYTPYDECALSAAGKDLGAPMLVPDLASSTPHTVAFGTESGAARLVERDRLPGRLDSRAPCGTDPSMDTSLLPPSHAPVATVATRNPPAFFRDADGQSFLFLAGQSATPPSVSRLKVAPFPSMPAYLNVDGGAMQVAMAAPGPPVVSSYGGNNAIVWVLDGNSALYAFDAPTLTILWQSPQGVLHPAGGGNQPLVVNGKVFVGTDRVQAFGLMQ